MRNKIKDERLALQMTQTQLAEKIGVSRQTIFSIEVNKYVPSVILALKLAVVFNKRVEELFYLDDEEK